NYEQLLICKALFLLIAAHPILRVLRMTHYIYTKKENYGTVLGCSGIFIGCGFLCLDCESYVRS
ncbi:hypothetical protein, partial [Bacteroides sp. UBA939]|uniref:hypothetical protein n=1 Tax=Bacteroides sp. UBA939 TaxID=1946092 RepID=UPI0025C10EA6